MSQAMHDFIKDLAWEKDQEDLVFRVLKNRYNMIYVDSWENASLDEDKSGTDLIVRFHDGRSTERIQFKFRRDTYTDILLEDRHHHDDGRITPGWINKPSTADTLCYVMGDGTAHWYSWPKLQAAWRDNQWLWRARQYSWSMAANESYTSWSIAIPIEVLDAAVKAVRL